MACDDDDGGGRGERGETHLLVIIIHVLPLLAKELSEVTCETNKNETTTTTTTKVSFRSPCLASSRR